MLFAALADRNPSVLAISAPGGGLAAGVHRMMIFDQIHIC